MTFSSRRIECADFDLPVSIETELWKEDGPTTELTPDRTRSNAEALSSLKARVLLTGYGGDELTWDPDWAPDLLRHGQILSAVGQAWQLSRWPAEDSFPASLRRAVVQSIPEGVRASLSGLRPRRSGQLPTHLQAGLDHYLDQGQEPDVATAGAGSLAQRTVLRWLEDPLLHWNLERLELRYASWARELRHPFFDRRLAELVLAIPFSRRVAPPGRRKALLLEAMQGLLPPEIAQRRSQVVFDAYFLEAWRQWQPTLWEVIHSSGEWLSEPYTDREKVLTLLKAPLPDEATSMRALSQIWAAVNLELWLRGLSRYSATQYDEASQSLGDVDNA